MDMRAELPITEGPVLASFEDGVVTITMNRPETLNAVTAPMMNHIEQLIMAASDLEGARAIVLRAAGKGFCSGADLSPEEGEKASTATIDAGNGVVTAMRQAPLPVVCVVQGACAGIGVSIALAADLVVASEKAFFLLAFANIGLMPDGGATALVSAAVGRPRAMRMALLGERVYAAQAEAWGLISHVVSPEALDEETDTLVRKLAEGPSRAYAATKHAVNEATLQELSQAFQRERYGQSALLHSADFEEGAAAFRERRPARFSGC
ncbi:enoyl-CoA hydratase [Gephyromycinifex aptenodytis]|uniref:enoyl-CoA hydratase n=1 Tax=Gephyromycinifex aptenodytis TaxID=2716227 RepID=UPI001B2FEE67|nr:enoyl-CoA hydratase [Gephyromycinifex aptenodytis]